MKALNRILITGIAAVAIFTGNVAAQRVVGGTGDPDIDIAAVQAAVDRGGSVVLRGHFSFDNPAREAAEEAAARQRQSRWIRNLLNWNRLQRKSRRAEAVG